jgi:hypothetical protein
MWKSSRLVCHDILDAVHISKMTTFEVEFDFREEECHTDSDQASMGTVEPLEYPCMRLKPSYDVMTELLNGKD